MTAEVRLVDADKLRRRIVKEREANVEAGQWDYGWRACLAHVAAILNSVPSSTAPKGWTRDEVLDELAKHPDNVCEVLCPYMGNWFLMPRSTIESWHPEVRRFDVRVVRSTPDPEWVPLTKLVGRTIHGETEPVGWFVPTAVPSPPHWEWRPDDAIHRYRPFPDGTLNLDDATVAVRPEAAT